MILSGGRSDLGVLWKGGPRTDISPLDMPWSAGRGRGSRRGSRPDLKRTKSPTPCVIGNLIISLFRCQPGSGPRGHTRQLRLLSSAAHREIPSLLRKIGLRKGHPSADHAPAKKGLWKLTSGVCSLHAAMMSPREKHLILTLYIIPFFHVLHLQS